MAKRKKKGGREGADSDSGSTPDTDAVAAGKPVDWDSIGREEELAAAAAAKQGGGDEDGGDEDGGDGDGDDGDPPEPQAPPSRHPMRSRRIVGAVMSITAPGTGHLAIDRPIRGLLWSILAVLVMMLFGISLKWFLIGAVVALVGSALDVGFSRPGPRRREWMLICLVWFGGFMVFGQIRGRIERGWSTGLTVQTASMSPNILFREWVTVHRRDKGGPGHVVGYERPCGGERNASRIVAGEGDTIEVRCGRAYVNGAVIPRKPAPGTCEFKHPVIKEKRFEKRACEQFEETLAGKSYRVIEQPEQFADANARAFPAQDASGSFVLPKCQGDAKRDVTGASLARGTVKRRSDNFDSADKCAPRAAYVVPKGHVFLLNDNRADADDSRSWGPVPVERVIGKVTQVWWSTREKGLNFSRMGARVR